MAISQTTLFIIRSKSRSLFDMASRIQGFRSLLSFLERLRCNLPGRSRLICLLESHVKKSFCRFIAMNKSPLCWILLILEHAVTVGEHFKGIQGICNLFGQTYATESDYTSVSNEQTYCPHGAIFMQLIAYNMSHVTEFNIMKI